MKVHGGWRQMAIIQLRWHKTTPPLGNDEHHACGLDTPATLHATPPSPPTQRTQLTGTQA